MATNLDRFKADLDQLILEGEMLDYAMVKQILNDDKAFTEQFLKGLNIGKAEAEKLISVLPNFNSGYEAWYSESLALLQQLLPDRVHNFVSFYEKPKSRKSIEYGNYVMQDFLLNITAQTGYGKVVAGPSAALPQFRQQVSILKAAKARFESCLFEIRQLVQADLFDSEIETARELLKNKFNRAAGAVAGVILEKHLRQVCDDHKVGITKKNPSIGDLNELLKSNSVIDVPQWRYISMLADIRNLCDHHKHAEPTATQVADLVDGTAKVIKTIV